jgi:hypothetical protein
MNADFSAAPEIAQLAVPFIPLPHVPGTAAPRTDGRLAGELARLAAAPQRWWDLVRFDPGGPVRVPVPGAEGAWLLVLPPGGAADCDCARAALLAGEAAEGAVPLRPGRVLLHGNPAGHRVRDTGHGFSVSLHSRSGFPERKAAPLSGSPVTVSPYERPGTAALPPKSQIRKSPGTPRRVPATMGGRGAAIPEPLAPALPQQVT